MGSPSWIASLMLVRWGLWCVTSSLGWSACFNVAMCLIPAVTTSSSRSVTIFDVLGVCANVGGPYAGWYNSLSESSDTTDFAFPFPFVGVSSSLSGGSTSVDSRGVRMLEIGG